MNSKVSLWSRYLLIFIIATLPLERIPSLGLVFSTSHITVRLDQLAGLALIAINLPLLWQQRRQLVQAPWRWLLLFLIACILSAGLALELKRAILVTFYTIFVGLLAWTISLRVRREDIPVYIKVLLVSALAVCVFGMYQFVGDLLGLGTAFTGLRSQYTKAVFGFPRIQSTALEPLYFGNYLLIPFALCSALVMSGRRKYLAGILVFVTTIAMTLARGAYAGSIVILTIACVGLLVRKQFGRTAQLLGTSIAGIILASVLIGAGSIINIQHNTSTSGNVKEAAKHSTSLSTGESAEGRTITRKLAINAFTMRPILGVGPGNFGIYAHSHMPARFTDTASIVNNEPLELLSETGIAGLLFLALFVAAITWRFFRLFVFSKRTAEFAFATGLFLALVGSAVQYQTFSTLYITYIWVAIGLLLGTLNAAMANKKS